MADLDDNNDEGGDLRDTLARSWSEMDDDFQHKKFSNIEDARDAVMAQVMALSDEDDGEESQEELALPSEDELARYWTRMGIEYRRKHFDNTSTSKTRKMNGRYCTKHGCYCNRTQCSTCLHDQLTLGQFIDTCAALKFRFALGAATQQRQQRQHNTRRHKEQRQQRRQQGQLRRLAARAEMRPWKSKAANARLTLGTNSSCPQRPFGPLQAGSFGCELLYTKRSDTWPAARHQRGGALGRRLQKLSAAWSARRRPRRRPSN